MTLGQQLLEMAPDINETEAWALGLLDESAGFASYDGGAWDDRFRLLVNRGLASREIRLSTPVYWRTSAGTEALRKFQLNTT